MDLKKKLIVILLAVGLLPIIFMGIFAVLKASSAIENEMKVKIDGILKLKTNNINTYINSIKSGMSAIGNSGDTASLFHELVRLHQKYEVKGNESFRITKEQDVLDAYAKYEEKFQKMLKDFNLYDVFIICKAHGHVMYTASKESDLGENLATGTLKDSALAEVWKKVVESNEIVFADMRPYAPSNNAPSIFMGAPIVENGQTITAISRWN